MGIRKDFRPKPEREWLVIGIQGLAPYFFDVDASLFVGESGRSAFRLSAEYELMLTQRWVLSPEIEMNFFGQNDREVDVGSGFSDIELGLRLRYEIRREFAPYIGINHSKQFANTANISKDLGRDVAETQWLIGVSAWF